MLRDARDAPVVVLCRQPKHESILRTLQQQPFVTLFEDRELVLFARRIPSTHAGE